MEAIARLIAVACAALALVNAGPAHSYPDHPVRIVVPFAPAGPTDIIARILADKLSASLGKQVYVVNQPGASGNTGTAMVAAAPPDGYTLLLVSTSLMVNPSMNPKVATDPVKAFAPISNVGVTPNVMLVHPSVPARTVQELVDLIRANPGKFSYASPGIGTTPHLSGEMFRVSQGLDLVPVMFGGAGPAIQSAVGGHTQIAFTAMPPAAPQVKEGTLRALAVTSERRSATLPEVPTVGEVGLAGQEAYTLQGLLAPAGTPRSVVDFIYAEVLKVVALPDVKERFAALGFEVVANTPDQFATQIKTEIEKWAKVIRDAKIKTEGTP
ncbi:MAG: tripartite tricarboxylate transporter substrate binding protein [Hyphomonadaceae bacterium]|jgi:tripartite-type tricarboxylate transporter receptor subunit TctC|nr:tripartite tricarboxylate transporter substrate binding protein [Hyphomonadaceae bacterium]